MNFSLNKSIQILERTPIVLEALLSDISDDWIFANEGENTFSPFDVVGHLVHGEKTDWVPRLEIILSKHSDKTFIPYDRFAQTEDSKGKTMDQLLEEFKRLRSASLSTLRSKMLTEKDFSKTGVHPKLGTVSLSQLLSTWTIHDLSHLAQISRIMCKHYSDDVGPWIEFLPILTRH